MPRHAPCIRLSIDPSTVSAPDTPASVEVDLSGLLPNQSFDHRTIRLWVGEEEVPVRFSDDFRFGARGLLHFVIADPGRLDYTITVESRSDAADEPRYVPAIGIGDALHHNSGRPLPFSMGWGAQINDLTGDGTPHLTTGTHWTTYFDWPMNTLHHRTALPGDGLVFDEVSAVRARYPDSVEPAVITEDFYIRHHMVDWDRDDRLDMVTVNSGRKEVRLYRNTGEPGPMFEWVSTFQTEGNQGYQGLWMVDLYGDGRLHLVTGGQEKLPGHETEPDFSYIQVYRNTASPGQVPVFRPPERLKLEDGSDIRFQGPGWSFVLTDLDGDGHPDLLYDRAQLDPPLVWYRNLGPCHDSTGIPAFRLEGPLEGIDLPPGHAAGLGWADCGSLNGPIVDGNAYSLTINSATRSPRLHSPRPILAANPEVSGGGQSWPHPVDWDGDGGMDLLAGHEAGYLQVFRNEGTRHLPRFGAAARVESEGEQIRIWRTGIFGGNHWHGSAGYTTPVYADWDGDGLPDLVVGSEVNRLFWFRNEGTRQAPIFGPRQQIEVDGYEDSPAKRQRSHELSTGESPYPFQADEAFWWRQKVAVLDWNGDGMADLVAVDGEGCYALYERYSGGGELRLRKSRRLVYEDGSLVTHDSIPRRTTGTDTLVVCDWRGVGKWDILTATCWSVLYLRNVGTNAEPVFARPEPLKLWGKEIHHSRHGLAGHAVDWDGDGRLSWLAGSEFGTFILFRRSALDANSPPTVRVAGGGLNA
jgi:hypothetical protein